ncbi:hypothetical protein D3C71_1010630 [compost metagenome]
MSKCTAVGQEKHCLGNTGRGTQGAQHFGGGDRVLKSHGSSGIVADDVGLYLDFLQSRLPYRMVFIAQHGTASRQQGSHEDESGDAAQLVLDGLIVEPIPQLHGETTFAANCSSRELT